MQLNQSLNPNLNISEPTKDFFRFNKTDKVLFDADLQKHLQLLKKPKVNESNNNIKFDYSYHS